MSEPKTTPENLRTYGWVPVKDQEPDWYAFTLDADEKYALSKGYEWKRVILEVSNV